MHNTDFALDFKNLLLKHDISSPKFAYGSASFDPSNPKVLYSGPMYDIEELVAGTVALVEGKWAVAGEYVNKFELEFSKYLEMTDSVMVNSGSSADLILVAAAKAHFNWDDGDGIIVSPVGFPTTISAITLNNLKPIFIDIEFETLNADNNLIEKALILNKNVKAIFVSPVLGNPPDIDFLTSLSKKYNVNILMDGCDSLGSTWNNKHLANYSFASSCSFFPSHHCSTLQGGMISSNDKAFINTAYSMATWGKACWCSGVGNMLPNGCCGKRFSNWLPLRQDLVVDHRYVFTTDKAYNVRPIDIQGALGCSQIKKLEKIHKNRRIAYDKISKYLSEYLKDIQLVKSLPKADPSWFGVPLICPSYDYKRKLIDHFEKNGIQTREYFAGNLLLQPGYQHLGNPEEYPNAQEVLKRVFFIGNAPFLTDDHFSHIEKTFKSFIK